MNTGIIRTLTLTGSISASSTYEVYETDYGCWNFTGSPSGNVKAVKQASGLASAGFGPCSVTYGAAYELEGYLFPTTKLTASGFGSTDVEAFVGVVGDATFSISFETELVYYHYPAGSIVYPVGAFPIAGGEDQIGGRCHVFGDRIFPGAAYTVTITAGGHTASVSGTVPAGSAGNIFSTKQPNTAWLPYEVRLTAQALASDQIQIWQNVFGACVLIETLPQQTAFCEIVATFLGESVTGDSVDHPQSYPFNFPFTATGNVNFGAGVRADAKGAKVRGTLNRRMGVDYELRAALRQYTDPYPGTVLASVYRDTSTPPRITPLESVSIGDGASPVVERESSWDEELYGIQSYRQLILSDGYASRRELVQYVGPSGLAVTLPAQTLPGGDPNGDSRMFIRLPIADAIKVKQSAEITLDAGTALTGWSGGTLI